MMNELSEASSQIAHRILGDINDEVLELELLEMRLKLQVESKLIDLLMESGGYTYTRGSE